ncbi:MAG: Stk1 family PASTA domain-containing Ser/Thr kinase [Eubacteriales bacterium]
MEQFEKYIGKVLDNRYNIEKLIGSGGMSYVFLATDSVMNRHVAIKLLRDELLSDEDSVDRFVNESKAVSMLSNENIIKCFDVSNGPELKYIVLEYVEGCTLKAYMQKKGILSAAEAMSYATAILTALVHAHSKNVIHRDIKPQNILLTSDGKLKLSDFGIAKIPTGDPLPISCKTVGTVDYISPEQAKGQGIDCRSDLYSLGIVMYEMVTGRLPFIGEDPMDVAHMQISDEPTPPVQFNPDLPKGLEQVIMRAIRKNPDERFDNAKQMLDCLLRLKNNPTATFDFVTFDTKEVHPAPKDSGDLLFSGCYLPDEQENGFKPVALGQPKVLTGRRRKKEGRKKPKKKVIRKKIVETKTSHVSLVSMLLGVLCAMGLIALTALLYVYENYFHSIISTDKNSEVLVVDDFEGQIYTEDLQTRLEKAGYLVTVEWVNDTDRLYSTIVSQSPKKNSRRTIVVGKQYCELTLYLSSGEDMFTLDNYIGLEYRQAGIEMTKNKLNVVFEKVYSDTMPQGLIVSTYPEGGTAISSDTTVTVYVSMGPKVNYTTVPNLVGLSMTEVASKLKSSDLQLGKVTYQLSSTVAAGKVISQSLYRGQTVPAGLTKIDLVVSQGSGIPIPDPDPIVTDPPATTQTPTPGTDEPDPGTQEPPSVTEPPVPETDGTNPSTDPPTPETNPVVPEIQP